MKKSLIIRWVVIALVILVWTLAMFPLKDHDYLAVFRKVIAPKAQEIQTAAEAFIKANGNPAEQLDKMNSIEDKNSQEFKDARAAVEKLRTLEGFDAWMKYRDLQELNRRLTLIERKAQYETAQYIKTQMEGVDQATPEYKALQAQYEQVTSVFKDWTDTLEYKELVRRLPAENMKAQMETMADKTSDAYHKLAEDYRKAAEALAQEPAFEDAAKKKEYDDTVARLSLVFDVDRAISGYKALELAANGNSNLYRIALNDFIKIPFHGQCSNKLVLRYLRVKSAGKLHLGLDLRGGTEFVLDFDIKEAQGLMVTQKVMQEFFNDFLNGNKAIADKLPEELAKQIKDFAAASGNLDNRDIARALVGKKDIADKTRDFLSANMNLIKKADTNAYGSVTDIRDRILSILDNRLNSMGVTEPEIKASGDNTISVRMPSVDEADKNEIRNTIRKAAKLEFFLVAENDAELIREYEADRQAFKTPAGLIRTEIEEERSNGSVSYTPVFLEETPTEVKGEDIERAFATADEYGRWIISLKFNGAGTVAFRNVTSKNVGRRLAIVLDSKVYSAPVLKTEIGNGQAVIEGTFTLEEAKRLASVIASGNVPVTVNIGSEFGTDPTLGSDSVENGLFAGILGLAIVVLFMLFYYRTAGFVAICALIVNTILVLGTMAITKATITMPGIAGMVLTIGMAVDANVIIFERIREELEAKASIVNAIKAGYGKAFSAIFDSNLTTLITCFALYKFGTGSVKGFAVTLSFGIFASMFTAIFMTRAIFDFFVHKDIITTLSMVKFKCISNLGIPYLNYRRYTVGFSIALVIISLVTFVVKGSNMMGIDFNGGTELAYECQGTAPDVDKIRSFLEGEGYSDNLRVGYKRGQSGERLLEIILPAEVKNGEEKGVDYTAFNERLDKAFPEVKISLKQTNAVGANVGSQFRSGAFWAAFFSLLGIIIYLAFRFEFMYGVGAAVAIIHDAIVSAGLFVLCGGTISLTVVAAIMTIMGYSLNDTIVIFDRLRETREARKNLTYSELINVSINECMSRTMLTSLTTMLVVICLLLRGGGAVFDFALVMFFGVITGTYSTIFVASAIINTWHKRTAAMDKAEAKAKAKVAAAK